MTGHVDSQEIRDHVLGHELGGGEPCLFSKNCPLADGAYGAF